MSLKGDAALTYLRRGWAVVPGVSVRANGICPCSYGALCDSPGKHPRVKWGKYQIALPTEAEVIDWWRRWPDANVLILTGAQSGIIAVDIDPRHSGDESLRDLGDLPETLTSQTGGGGQHLIYQHPGYEMRNAAGLVPGIDFRGDGGYIVAPPSSHSSGNAYAWDLGQPDEPAPLPEKIRSLYNGAALSVGLDPVAKSRRFDEERMLSDPIPQGLRNETLVRIAGHYAADGRPYHDLLRTVLGCNYDLCQPPLERVEVVKLVDSIFDAERRKRQVADALEHHLNGGSGEEISAIDAEPMARRLWAELGIDGVIDWYIIRGDTSDYVLVTDSDEIKLGDDLLNQGTLRKRLLNETKLMLKPIENKREWPKRALLLRQVAREVVSEPSKAIERLGEWIDAFAGDDGPIHEPAIEDRAQWLTYRPVVIDGRMHLKPEALVRFIELQMAERLKISDLRKLLKRAGWSPATVRTHTSTARAWAVDGGPLYAGQKTNNEK